MEEIQNMFRDNSNEPFNLNNNSISVESDDHSSQSPPFKSFDRSRLYQTI